MAAMAQILDTLGFMGRVYEKFILKHMKTHYIIPLIRISYGF
jgi:hypothetical protein